MHRIQYPGIRRVWATFVLLVSLPALRSAAEQPYPAFVAEELTAVRSGPGDQFYETGELLWGSRVEVYRHDEDYAAIRPPEGSFSWIPTEALDVDASQTIATVRLPNFKTRIGSTEFQRFDAEYVTLKVGEQVEVLGFQTGGDDTGVGEWVKISPPAGEFRWVKLSDLQKTPPVRDVSDLTRIDTEVPLDIADESTIEDLKSADADHESLVAASPDSKQADDLSTLQDDIKTLDKEASDLAELIAILKRDGTDDRGTSSGVDSDSAPDEAGSRVDLGEQEVALVQWSSPVDEGTDAVEPADDSGGISELVPQPNSDSPFGFSEVRRRPGVDASPAYLADQLAKLELAVSQEVCKPTSQWQLASIQARCLAVIDAAASAEIRQRAYVLLAKVVQFEDVRRRELRLAPSQPDALVPSPASLAGAPSPMPTSAYPPVAPAAIYDGTGWLMPVLTNRRDVPRYVLTDDQGQVLQFVSPQPGLNLSRYERKKIGIFGQRGYLPSVSQPHLMAERVVTLDKVR